ncbi:hypothetical protein B0T12DRAFT_334793, partial [Alternaria alternata]
TMRTSWLLFAVAYCTTSYSQGTQQMLGSLDLLGNSYKCENGVKPSFECTDNSAQPSCNCACTCSNGLLFNRTLSAGPTSGSLPGSDTCNTDRDECLQRKKDYKDSL